MNQPTLSFTFPVYTVKEYLGIIHDELKMDNQSLIEKGFPKWDKEWPQAFIEAANHSFSITSLPTQFLLDVGDREWIWLVNMSTAMVIKKP